MKDWDKMSDLEKRIDILSFTIELQREARNFLLKKSAEIYADNKKLIKELENLINETNNQKNS